MSAPNEVYRKDLVSAMLITELPPDSSVHFQLQDNWKTEWERGVQVPAKLRQRKPQVDLHRDWSYATSVFWWYLGS